MLASLYWHSLQRIPIAVLVIVGVIVVTLWLYPPQVRLLGKLWRWVLPGLRAVAMGALAISILQPVMIRPKNAIERGAVVVLLDDSRSMSVIDLARTPAQQVALAAALGRLPPGTRDAEAVSLQADADRLVWLSDAVARARSEVDYARLAGHGVDVAQSRLDQSITEFLTVAQSSQNKASTMKGSGVLQNTLASLAQTTTGAARDAWLDQLRPRVISASAEIEQARTSADQQLFRNDPQVHDACLELSKLSRLELAHAAITQGNQSLIDRLGAEVSVLGFGVGDHVTPFSVRGGEPTTMPISADGSASNLTGAVRAVLDHLQGTPVRALVLYSDGRQVGGDMTIPSGLSASGVPVYTVGVAPLGGLRDVSIVHCSVPSSAFVGETITVRADVRALGLPNAQADVIADIAGVTQTQHIAFTGDKPMPVEFTQKLSTAGQQSISINVSKVPGEATDENNHVQRTVKVLDQKIKVAAYAGTAGWDFQYVRNALTRTAWAQAEDGILPDATVPFPLTVDEILKQDVLLLFDVAVGSLDAAQWDAVNRLVTERGGSVILVAGDAHLPGEYAAGPITSGLLPYPGANLPAWKTWPGERPSFHFAPAPGAADLDALKFGQDAQSTPMQWDQLPAFFRFLPISPLKQNTRPLLIETDSGSAVLTESRLGIGRVLFFGADETWRWRYKTGEKNQDRFWLQLIRYAAEEPYAVHQGGVSIDADLVDATPQQPIHMRARVLGDDGSPRAVPACELKIMQGEQNIRTQQMTASGVSASGRYEATVTDLPEGDYRFQVDPGNSLPQPQIPVRVKQSTEAEMADLSGDDTVLRRLATSSGGQFFWLDQVDALPAKLTEIRDDSSRFVETRLWDSGYLYAFVLGCLGAEWALRKRFGLA